MATNLAGIISTGLDLEATPTCVVNTSDSYSGKNTILSCSVTLLYVASLSILSNAILNRVSCTNVLTGVAYDTYTGSVYWSTDGGSGQVFRRRGIEGQPEEEITTAVNPSVVKLDWVTLRLFWVTTNPRQIVSVSLEDSSPTVETFQPLNSAGVNQELVAMDSRNG